MKKLSVLSLAFAFVLLIGACTPQPSYNSSSTAPAYQGRNTSISIVDSSERIKLDTKITLSDIIAFAENLTNKMLQSPAFANKKRLPRIVVADIRQNTHDENLRVQDIHDRIIEVLFNSGQVRVVDSSATGFDYIMQSEITDIVTRAPDGQKLVDYTMKIKLFDINGELKGQWSDDLSLFKNR